MHARETFIQECLQAGGKRTGANLPVGGEKSNQIQENTSDYQDLVKSLVNAFIKQMIQISSK